MSAHTVIRFADWTMRPESASEAPDMVHELQRATCLAASSADEDFEIARDCGGPPHTAGSREPPCEIGQHRQQPQVPDQVYLLEGPDTGEVGKPSGPAWVRITARQGPQDKRSRMNENLGSDCDSH